MKQGLECSVTPEIVRECECRGCSHFTREEIEDPFKARVKNKDLGYHFIASKKNRSSAAKATAGSIPAPADKEAHVKFPMRKNAHTQEKTHTPTHTKAISPFDSRSDDTPDIKK
jgi:hypothetical protein